MSRYGKTKSDMLRLISQRKDTLSEISSELALASSTVSKHLNELQELGAITLVESEYAKKWKHYRLNRSFNGEFPETIAAKISYGRETKSKYAFAGLLIIAAIAGLFAFSAFSQNQSNQVPIAITDPPYLPAGTSAVYLNYSSISLNYSSGGVNSTVPVNASGTLDVMNLVNVTKVIALADVKPGSRLRSVSINISSGSIVINNSTYALTIPVKHFTIAITGNSTVNAFASILIDLSSVVVPYSANNSTGSESFAFMPRLSSMLASTPEYQNTTNISGPAGMHGLWDKTFAVGSFGQKIAGLSNQNQNVKINNVSIARTVNGTEFSFSLANRANYTSNVEGVAILSCNFNQAWPKIQKAVHPYGNNANWAYNISNGVVTINISRLNANSGAMDTIKINKSLGIREINLVLGKHGFKQGQGMFPIPMLGLYFGVDPNGTLSAYSWGIPNALNNEGYALAPQHSLPFNYNAATGSPQGYTLRNIINGGAYRVVVFTSNGIIVYTKNSSAVHCGD